METAIRLDSPAVVARGSRAGAFTSVPAAGFTPGAILADRYRVIGLLGRGGMGEVYRADDLKLGQAVALKFLPRALANERIWRERLFEEVRIARQVSHPNVCRVYDIGEYQGQHFISMEFIDGEDLASLLKRIGYLPSEKALEIGRQLVAGLAAAHNRGVLHRDLKPANVMIDGRGRVRITDFGLAVSTTDDKAPGREAAGTPAYMAPEQLEGSPATVRTDIYALGLVLYEVYTGRKAFTATTYAGLRKEKSVGTPIPASQLRDGVAPVVDRLISRCLDRNPEARPPSAAHVAAALPGGDPLEAALAAGETPSPEMVAAFRMQEGVRPLLAWGLLAFVIAGVIGVVVLQGRTMLIRRLPLGKSPDALAERARELIKEAGYTEEAADSAFGFEYDKDFLAFVQGLDATRGRWKKLDAYNPLLFWFRQSPRPLERDGAYPFGLRSDGTVITPDQPPARFSGDVLVRLDAEGRLRNFVAVPPQVVAGSVARAAPDWSRFFADAGFDQSKWAAVEPGWNPLYHADAQSAWQGALPQSPDISMRIEASAYRGRPVSFEVIGPWTRPLRLVTPQLEGGPKLFFTLLWVIFGTCLVGGIFYARRNLRLGRGDPKGATRLMVSAVTLGALSWILSEHHVATQAEARLFVTFAGWAMFGGGFLWMLYIALEPFARRRSPEMLVSWTRLLAGDWRDSLVGRDVLVGCATGVATSLLFHLAVLAPTWIGRPEASLLVPELGEFSGLAPAVLRLCMIAVFGIVANLALFFLLVLFRGILRSEVAAGAAWIFFFGFVFLGGIQQTGRLEGVLIVGPFALAVAAIVFFMLTRIGWLAFVAGRFASDILIGAPLTFQPSVWYASLGQSMLVVLAAMVFYGFRMSLGRRSLVDLAE